MPGTPSSRTLTTTTRSRPKLNIATAFPVSAAPVYQCWASSICGNSARVASNMPRLTIAGRRRCVVPQRWFRRRVALDTSSGPTRPSSCRPRSDRKGRSNSAGLAILSLVESVPPKRLQSITPALPGIESEECMFDIIGRHPRSPRGVGHELDDVHVRGSRDEGTRVGRIAQPAFHLPQCTRRSGRNPVDWPCLKTSERTIYVVLCLVELGGIEPPSIRHYTYVLRPFPTFTLTQGDRRVSWPSVARWPANRLSESSSVFPNVSSLFRCHPPLLVPGCGGSAPCAISGHDVSSLT